MNTFLLICLMLTTGESPSIQKAKNIEIFLRFAVFSDYVEADDFKNKTSASLNIEKSIDLDILLYYHEELKDSKEITNINIIKENILDSFYHFLHQK